MNIPIHVYTHTHSPSFTHIFAVLGLYPRLLTSQASVIKKEVLIMYYLRSLKLMCSNSLGMGLLVKYLNNTD